MKRAFVICSLLLLSFSTFISCREAQEKETIVREKEVEREQQEEPKGILERTGEKVDREVNKEIDEEVEKIGNDN